MELGADIGWNGGVGGVIEMVYFYWAGGVGVVC